MYRYNISLTSKPPLNKPSSKNDNNINREDSTSNRNLIMERKMRALQFVRKMNGHKESNGNSNKAGFLEGNGNFIVLAEPPPPPPPIPPHEQSPTPPPPPPPTPPSQPLKVEPQQQQIVDMEMETTPIRPQIQQKQLPKSVTFATDIEIKKEIDEGQQSQANNSQFKSPSTFAKSALKNSSDVGQSGTKNLQQQKSSQPVTPKSALKKKSTGKKEAPLPRTFFMFIAKGMESEAIKMAMEKEAQSPEERMASIVGEKAETAERERRLEIQRRMKREDVMLREKARKLKMSMTTQSSANAGYGSCSGSSVDSGRPRSAASIDSYDHQQQHPGPGSTSMMQNAACEQEHWQQHDASSVNVNGYHPQQNLQNGWEWEHRPQPQQKVVSVAWSLKPVDGIVAPFSWRTTVEQWRLELEIADRHAELVRTDFDAINKTLDAALHTNKITPPAPKLMKPDEAAKRFAAEELTPQQQKRATRKLFLANADDFGGTSKVGKEQQRKPEEEEGNGNGTFVQSSSIEMHEKNNDADEENEEHQRQKEKQAEAEKNCNINSSSNQMHNEPQQEQQKQQLEEKAHEEKANMEEMEMEEGEIEDDQDEVEEWPGAAVDAVEEYAGQEFEQWQPAEDGEQQENEDGGQQQFDDQFGQKQMDEEEDANGNGNDDVLQVPYSPSPQLHQEQEKEEAICEAHNFTGLLLDQRDGPMEGNLEEGEIIEFDETQQRQIANIEEQRQIAKIEAKLLQLQQRGLRKGQNKENKDNIHTGNSNHHQLQQQENQQQNKEQQENSSASMLLRKRPSILVEEEEEQQQNEQTSSSFGSFQDCGAGPRQQSISIDIDNSPEYIVLDDTMEMDSQLTPPLPSSRRRTLDGSAGKRGPASKRKKTAGAVDEIRRRSEPGPVQVRLLKIGDEEVLCIDDDD